jgi:hypothetical protein
MLSLPRSYQIALLLRKCFHSQLVVKEGWVTGYTTGQKVNGRWLVLFHSKLLSFANGPPITPAKQNGATSWCHP